jgi:cytochrome c biogenesis protein
VQITTKDGKTLKSRIEVNKPLIVDGVAIYQSSFDDGGSKLKLVGYPMTGASTKPVALEGEVGGATNLAGGDKKLTLEFAGLRVFNVENMQANPGSGSGADVRKVDLSDKLAQHLGSGAKTKNSKELRNVGPSVTYKLRDAAGQAREFHNYQLPVMLEGQRIYLAGLRDTPAEPFRYLRIPADDKDEIDGFMLLRAALASPELRAKAVARFAEQAAADNAALKQQIAFSASRALDLFAGVLPANKDKPATGGLQAISDFMEGTVPAAERESASGVLLKLLNGALYQLYQAARENAKLAPAAQNEALQQFLTQSVLALSDSFNYGAPLLFALQDFTHIQASVFQVARAPGKNLVYLGCFLLIVGVFAMLYVRERRLWVLLKDTPSGGTSALLALSTTRKTLDFEKEFTALLSVFNKLSVSKI